MLGGSSTKEQNNEESRRQIHAKQSSCSSESVPRDREEAKGIDGEGVKVSKIVTPNQLTNN